MAMYESHGFCPNNSFLHYALEKGDATPANWRITQKLLGDRTGYMVYTKAGNAYYGYSYVVDALIGATDTLGIEVACKLQALIPVCKYAETGRMILITDVINPFLIPGVVGCNSSGDESRFVAGDNLTLIEDERYLVGITEEGDAVHMYFFKKVSEQ